MAFEPTPPEKAARFKYRIRFAKHRDLRLVSHHDLMHCCERLFRRADLPIAFSGGFHPMPRMIFALSLPLGVAGANEVLELELTRHVTADELLTLLRRHGPAGLDFHSARELPIAAKAQPRRALYCIHLPAVPADLSARCAELFAADQLCVERAKPQPRRVNIRPFLHQIQVEGNTLRFALWVTPNGSAKAEELLRLLELDGLLEEGSVLERYDLELSDEVGADAPAPPSIDPGALSAPLHENRAVPLTPEDAAPRPTSLIEGPLSFDS